MISRADKSLIGNWWWTIDRLLLFAVLLLIVMGFIFSFAASPPIAEKRDLETFYYVKRHAIFLIPTLFIIFYMSLVELRVIRRIALIIFILGMLAMIYTLFSGVSVKGSSRWIYIANYSLQPSEFVKPCVIILSAWFFSEQIKHEKLPGNMLAVAAYLVFISVVLLQPDYGQAILTTAVWGVLLFISGISWIWILLLFVVSISSLIIIYNNISYFASRVDKFLIGFGDKTDKTVDTFQIDNALAALKNGGLFGVGPGEGVIKRNIPDAHNDFIFAVIGEEFGLLTCALLLLLYFTIFFLVIMKVKRKTTNFERFALIGLICLFTFQVLINISVNLDLLPTKGMTLPFISYGGSSMLSTAITMGVILNLCRNRISEESDDYDSLDDIYDGNI